jgi:hypothetical protein
MTGITSRCAPIPFLNDLAQHSCLRYRRYRLRPPFEDAYKMEGLEVISDHLPACH